MSINYIHRATLQRWLSEGGVGRSEELAVVDVRPIEAFAKGHPLFATNVPLDQFEREIERYVPRKSVRLVLVDGGERIAHRAAELALAHGYEQVNVLTGGVPAWLEGGVNGLPTFDIPGIVFSESIRDLRGTPSIDAATLKEHYDARDNVIVIDTRTADEFVKGRVPKAVNVPGEEILYRFLDVVPDAKTLVVVSCAGLPRAIIGAQTLIDAGVPNHVVFLEDGTAGWTRIGLELERGELAPREKPSARALAFAKDRAERLASHAKQSSVSHDDVARWRDQGAEQTTYVLDVRSLHEFNARHLPGSVSAPGGQLLAVSHRTVATRGARLVLVDDDGIRASTTAHWLRERGWDVHVLRDAFAAHVDERARDASTAAAV